MEKPYAFGQIELTPQQLRETSDAMLRTLLELGENALALAERDRDVRYFELRRLVSDIGIEIECRHWKREMLKREQPSLFGKAPINNIHAFVRHYETVGA